MSIPNFGDSIPILDVDPVLFFQQIDELVDTALAYDFQASSDFSVVETAIDHVYKAWLNVPLSNPDIIEKLIQLSTAIIMHFTVRTPKDMQQRYGAVMNKINYLYVLKKIPPAREK